jgi:hypothetical protein
MAMDELNTGLATLRTRSKVAGALIFAYLGLEVICLSIDSLTLARALGTDEESAIAEFISIALILNLLVFIASAVVISMWIHRAHANLFAANLDGLEYTPGWSVGWFFVPFANLVKPYQAMRELYNRSHGLDDRHSAPSPSELIIWWVCYLAGNIAGNISFRLDDGSIIMPPTGSTMFAILSSGLMIVSAVILKRMIDSITAAQGSMMGVSETFA